VSSRNKTYGISRTYRVTYRTQGNKEIARGRHNEIPNQYENISYSKEERGIRELVNEGRSKYKAI